MGNLGEGRGMDKTAVRSRRLSLESLENRELLSVSSVEFDQIRAQYADLNLSANMGDYNIIEITAAQLSETALGDAIGTAASSAQNDLIVTRTTETQNVITLTGSELTINANTSSYGSVTIVSFGDTALTIDANQQSRVLGIDTGANVALGGLAITGGQAIEFGGGISNSGTLFMTECTISGNQANSYNDLGYGVIDATGGGIYNTGSLTVTNSTISKNAVKGSGGGISNSGMLSEDEWILGTLTVINCTISENSATSGGIGGGIDNLGGTLTVTNCTITENSALNSGGGIGNQSVRDEYNGSATITNSTISGNSADRGGGIYNESTNMLTVANGVISGNNGEGIYNSSTDALTVTNSTISGNSGCGIFSISSSSALIINNTIVAKNSLPDVKEGVPGTITGNNNLIGNGEDSELAGTGNIVGTETSPIDPKFVDFAAYTTWTSKYWEYWDLRLDVDSLAIDKGDNALAVGAAGYLLMVDRDGNDRVINGTVDIGAYEYEGDSPKLTAPTLTIGTPTTNSVPLSWNVITEATGYVIEKSDNNGQTWSSVEIVTSSLTTSTTATGLTPNTAYLFRIKATDNTEEYDDSSWSYKDTLTYPETPSNLEATKQAANTITLAWTAPTEGAASYKLEYSLDGSTNWTQIGGAISGTSYTHSTLDSNTEYYYRVSAVNATGTGTSTSVQSYWTLLETPTNFGYTNRTDASVTLAWDSMDDATGYQVQYRIGTGAWSSSNVSFSGATATISALTPNTAYDFQVQAINSPDDNFSEWASLPLKTLLETPTGLQSTDKTDNTVTLEWNTVSGATNYQVQYRTGTEPWSTSQVTVVGTIATVSNLTPNTSYEFQVRAIETTDNNDSAWSSSLSVTTDKIQLTSITPSTNSPQVGTAIITTLAPSGATVTYQWYRGTTSSTVTTVISGATSDSYTPTVTDIGYYLRVEATGAENYTGTVDSTLTNAVTALLISITPSTNSPQVGTAITTTLAPSGATVTYQWYRGTTSSTVTTAISGATSDSYTPTATDIGYYLRVEATGAENYTGRVGSTLTVPVEVIRDAYENSLVQSQGLDAYATWTNFDGTAHLTAIDAVGVGLSSSLYLSDCTYLQTLYCNDNQLTALNVSGCTALRELHCYSNPLGTLDVSTNTELTNLLCFSSQLTALDVSDCSKLIILWCFDNQLTTLDVPPSSAMISLYCHSNQLTSLNLFGTPIADFASATKTEYSTYDQYSYASLLFPILSVDNTVTLFSSSNPAIPQVTVTNQADSVRLDWTFVPGADRYEILRQNSDGSWTTLDYTTALQYVDSTVTPNVATGYIVRACQGSTVSAFNIVYGKALLPITAPQVIVTNQPGSVKLTWGVIAGADRYEILRQNSDGSWMEMGFTTALQYIDATATPNVATSYIVRACQGSTVSAFNIVYGRALPPITAPQVIVTNQPGSVKLNWTAVGGAEGYEILRQNSDGSWATLAAAQSLQYVDTSATPNVAAGYIVRAYAGTVVSGFTIVYGKAQPNLGIPQVAVTNQPGSVKLDWVAVDGAEDYEILRQNSDGSWTSLATVQTLQYIDTTTTPDVATSYIVRARQGSMVSGFNIVYGKAQPTITAPQVVVTNQPGSVKLDWTKIDGADRYEILRQNSDGSWTSLAYTKALQHVDTTATLGMAAGYIVRACAGTSVSGFIIVYGKAQLAAPQVIVTNQPGGVKLDWTRIDGADRYEILRQNSDGSWTSLAYTTTLQHIDTAAIPNVATSYIVRACAGTSVSGFTIVYGKAQPNLGIPQVAVTNQPGSVKLGWAAVDGAEGYEILRQNSDGSWTSLATVQTLQYVDTAAIPNVATSYIVRARQGSMVSGFTIVYGKALPGAPSASFFALSEAEVDELFLLPIA